MRKIWVRSQKYDGTLRDEQESYLYAEDAASIMLVTPPGTAYFHHRKQAWFTGEDGSLDFYFKHKWYNVWHICEQHSQINCIYANITLPATWQADCLTWIDLDLDLRVHLDGSLELLDEDEFLENSRRMNYPSDVVAHARAAVVELQTCHATGAYPFNHHEQVVLYASIQQIYDCSTGYGV